MKKNHISQAVIKRLPRYRRYLSDLKKKGVEKISSKELSKLIGYTASQIRQDLNNFGGFGQQGYGYGVSALYDEITKILGIDKEYNMVLVGAGNLGTAVSRYVINHPGEFKILAAFDKKSELVDAEIDGVHIYSQDRIEEFLDENPANIGIICVNKDSAQSVCDRLVSKGIKGIWNFAPVDLEIPDGVVLENVHLSDSLHSLTYYMKHEELMSKLAEGKKQKSKTRTSKSRVTKKSRS